MFKFTSGPINPVNIQPISPTDATASGSAKSKGSGKPTKIHLRIQNRTGKKCLTYIQGLPESVDLKQLCQTIRRKFNCNCTEIDHPKIGKCVQMSGDFRKELCEYFVTTGVVESTKNIKIHGF